MTAKPSIMQIEPAILRKPQAALFMGVGETLFAAQVARKKYPASRALGDGTAGWLVAELRACANALPLSDFKPAPGRKASQVDQPAA